jgi:HAE1 family hydrophobic/amphiphilic exporter-1
VAVIVSGVVSLTLTPMLASRFLRPHREAPNRLYRWTEKVFDGMLALYSATLRGALRIKLLVLLLSFGIMAWTAYLFVEIPKGFLPSEDTGRIQVTAEAAQGIAFPELVKHQKALAEIVRQDPNIQSFMSSCGARGASANTGNMFIRLKPRRERTLSADEVIDALRPKLSAVPGVMVFPRNPPIIQVGGQVSKSLYQFSLQSPDFAELYGYAPRLEARLRQLPGLEDVTSDLLIKNPQINVEIDRDKATALGVSAYGVEDALYTAYGTRQVSTIYAPNNQYYVIMELLPRFQSDPRQLDKLYVRAANGRLVPLPALAKIAPAVGPLTVNHVGQLPSVTLSFNLKSGVSLGQAVEQVEQAARETLPASITTSFQGTAQAFQASLQGMGLLMIMAIIVIYIVLGILYESFIHPITILSGLPSAGLGALLTLMYFQVDLNLYAMVGIIMLIGIVKKNAIMMIDFALEAERKEGRPPAEAIYEACRIRFRPIMMTTMAALMGTLPIAMGYGAGGEARQPLGLTVVGGLVVSQLITLYLTPVVYIYLDKLQRVFRRQRAADSKI